MKTEPGGAESVGLGIFLVLLVNQRVAPRDTFLPGCRGWRGKEASQGEGGARWGQETLQLARVRGLRPLPLGWKGKGGESCSAEMLQRQGKGKKKKE